MNRTEAQISKAVMIEASKLGLRVFRNNVGLFYALDVISIIVDSVKKGGLSGLLTLIRSGRLRKIMCGLHKGSADLIGWMPSPNHAFVSIEVKKVGGRPSKFQLNWMKQVQLSGGFACIINNEEQLKEKLDEYIKLR